MAMIDPDLTVETAVLATGADLVIGCDEVGRGALAGPVVVGVVAITTAVTEFPKGLRDSKLLSAASRERLYSELAEWGSARAVGEATAAEIDEQGIVSALGLAACRALEQIVATLQAVRSSVVLLDGSHDWLAPALRNRPLPHVSGIGVTTRPKADRDCASAAAASVLAKVHRDRLMTEAGEHYPEYGWNSNKGYGSAAHLAAIDRHGATVVHRRTWLRTGSR